MHTVWPMLALPNDLALSRHSQEDKIQALKIASCEDNCTIGQR